jgi:hypothetical protein
MMKDPELPERPEDTQRMPVPPEAQSKPVPGAPPAEAVEYGLDVIPEEVEPEPPGVPERRAQTPEQLWARALEEDSVPSLANRNAVLDKVDEEGTGLTVGDGFRFGCGFALAMAIGALALLIVVTLFFAVGTLVGFKPPF